MAGIKQNGVLGRSLRGSWLVSAGRLVQGWSRAGRRDVRGAGRPHQERARGHPAGLCGRGRFCTLPAASAWTLSRRWSSRPGDGTRVAPGMEADDVRKRDVPSS